MCSAVVTPFGRIELRRPDAEIDLNIIVLRATESPRERDPLFVLAGGPGQAPSTIVNFSATTFAEVRRRRDIVLLDLRGTGKSGPLTCPELAILQPNRTARRQLAAS